MRALFAGVAGLFLSVCVLLGTWMPVVWLHGIPLWAGLAIAATVGCAAGALAPRRELPVWLAWPILVVLAWAFYAYGVISGMISTPTMPRFLVYPLAASVGVAAGLVAWRMPLRSAWRLVPIALGAAAVAGIFFLHIPLVRWGTPGLRPAPAFTLHLLNGKRIAPQALAGKTVVLSFWATWCTPCREELPALQRLYEKHYAGRDDVRFYLVDAGYGAETATRAREFLAHLKVTMPAAYDAGGELAGKLDTAGVLPVRVVIGPRGLVCLTDYGYTASDADFPALRRAIAEALRHSASLPAS